MCEEHSNHIKPHQLEHYIASQERRITDRGRDTTASHRNGIYYMSYNDPQLPPKCVSLDLNTQRYTWSGKDAEVRSKQVSKNNEFPKTKVKYASARGASVGGGCEEDVSMRGRY